MPVSRRAAYRTHRASCPAAALLDLLAERLTDYRALVRVVTAATLAAEVSAALERRAAARTRRRAAGLGLPLPGLRRG